MSCEPVIEWWMRFLTTVLIYIISIHVQRVAENEILTLLWSPPLHFIILDSMAHFYMFSKICGITTIPHICCIYNRKLYLSWPLKYTQTIFLFLSVIVLCVSESPLPLHCVKMAAACWTHMRCTHPHINTLSARRKSSSIPNTFCHKLILYQYF